MPVGSCDATGWIELARGLGCVGWWELVIGDEKEPFPKLTEKKLHDFVSRQLRNIIKWSKMVQSHHFLRRSCQDRVGARLGRCWMVRIGHQGQERAVPEVDGAEIAWFCESITSETSHGQVVPAELFLGRMTKLQPNDSQPAGWLNWIVRPGTRTQDHPSFRRWVKRKQCYISYVTCLQNIFGVGVWGVRVQTLVLTPFQEFPHFTTLREWHVIETVINSH